MRSQTTRRCPKCGSANLTHKNELMDELGDGVKERSGHIAIHAMQGHPGMALLGAGLWAAGKVITAFKRDWSCNSCGHSFD